jgi:hypothetical protein
MKTPIEDYEMNSAERLRYIREQKKMIHGLQVQLTKSLESVATHRAALRGLWETPESESVRKHVASLLACESANRK